MVLGLTRTDIMANTMLFFLAGFQTTADSMLFLMYELAHHPEIQQKVSSNQNQEAICIAL